MKTRRNYALWIGSALLAVTALFHLSGFAAIPASPGSAGPAGFFENALRPLWLFAGLHWLLIAILTVLVGRSNPKHRRAILSCCTGAILIDAALLGWFLGPFIGSFMLAAAGIALLIASFRTSSEPTTV